MIIQSPKISINSPSTVIDNRIIGKARALYVQVARSMITNSSFVKRSIMGYDINIKCFKNNIGNYIYGYVDIAYISTKGELLKFEYVTRIENEGIDEYRKFGVGKESIIQKITSTSKKANIYWESPDKKYLITWKGPPDKYSECFTIYNIDTVLLTREDCSNLIYDFNGISYSQISSFLDAYLYINNRLINTPDDQLVQGAAHYKDDIFLVILYERVDNDGLYSFLYSFNLLSNQWNKIKQLNSSNILNFISYDNTGLNYKYNYLFDYGYIARFNDDCTAFCISLMALSDTTYYIVREFTISQDDNFIITEITNRNINDSKQVVSNTTIGTSTLIDNPYSFTGSITDSKSLNQKVKKYIAGDYDVNNLFRALYLEIDSFNYYRNEVATEDDNKSEQDIIQRYDIAVKIYGADGILLETLNNNYLYTSYSISHSSSSNATLTERLNTDFNEIRFVHIDVKHNVYLYYLQHMSFDSISGNTEYITDLVLYNNNIKEILNTESFTVSGNAWVTTDISSFYIDQNRYSNDSISGTSYEDELYLNTDPFDVLGQYAYPIEDPSATNTDYYIEGISHKNIEVLSDANNIIIDCNCNLCFTEVSVNLSANKLRDINTGSYISSVSQSTITDNEVSSSSKTLISAPYSYFKYNNLITRNNSFIDFYNLFYDNDSLVFNKSIKNPKYIYSESQPSQSLQYPLPVIRNHGFRKIQPS